VLKDRLLRAAGTPKDLGVATCLLLRHFRDIPVMADAKMTTALLDRADKVIE
jgi:hypothetical protein